MRDRQTHSPLPHVSKSDGKSDSWSVREQLNARSRSSVDTRSHWMPLVRLLAQIDGTDATRANSWRLPPSLCGISERTVTQSRRESLSRFPRIQLAVTWADSFAIAAQCRKRCSDNYSSRISRECEQHCPSSFRCWDIRARRGTEGGREREREREIIGKRGRSRQRRDPRSRRIRIRADICLSFLIFSPACESTFSSGNRYPISISRSFLPVYISGAHSPIAPSERHNARAIADLKNVYLWRDVNDLCIIVIARSKIKLLSLHCKIDSLPPKNITLRVSLNVSCNSARNVSCKLEEACFTSYPEKERERDKWRRSLFLAGRAISLRDFLAFAIETFRPSHLRGHWFADSRDSVSTYAYLYLSTFPSSSFPAHLSASIYLPITALYIYIYNVCMCVCVCVCVHTAYIRADSL